MTKQVWNEVCIKTTNVISGMLSEYLNEEGAEGIVIEKNDEEEQISYYITLKAYFPQDKEYLAELIHRINYELDYLVKANYDVGSREIAVNEVADMNWENSWQKFFEPFRVGNHLVIKPIWSEYEAKKDDVVINFDPGGFFGATPHPSTRLCLEEIEVIANNTSDKENYNILDLGSGSGILSLALYSMGLKKITAIDIDPIAISTSEENFSLSDMNIKLFMGELKDCNETYDLIAGNLLAEIIEELAEQIAHKLNKNGLFIGAGITKQQEAHIAEVLEKVGITIESKRYLEEWVLLKGKKR